jgi:hypothetical protein
MGTWMGTFGTVPSSVRPVEWIPFNSADVADRLRKG